MGTLQYHFLCNKHSINLSFIVYVSLYHVEYIPDNVYCTNVCHEIKLIDILMKTEIKKKIS